MTFTCNNTNTINNLSNDANGVFKKETRYSVSINILDLPMGAACRLINNRLHGDFTFKIDPAGWVNVYDGAALIGTIE